MKRLLFLFGLVLALSGCAASYKSASLTARTETLDSNKSVYVAIPPDGGYSAKVAIGSGHMAAQSLARAFTETGVKVTLGTGVETPELSLESARAAGAGYVADLVLASWEQRATAWSGRPSRLSITVRMRNATTGEVLDTSVLDSRSRYITVTFTSPESLLVGSMRGYVKSLYQAPAIVSK
ncbi:hypothetical protein D9M72_85880 [compost metagenome]